MPTSYHLQRGGHSIEVQKEPEYFTAILPSAEAVEEVYRMKEVREIKRVFHKVYKLRTLDYLRDDLMDQMRRQKRLDSVCHHAYNPVGDPATRYYLTDKIVVCFNEKASSGKIEDILSKHGLIYLKEYSGCKKTYLLQVTASAGKNPIKVANDLAEYSMIKYAEPNLVNRFQPAYNPLDILFPNQWHLHSRGGIELLREADVDATEAWNISKGSRNVVVGVIDDGFDLTHPDLRGPGKVVFPRDFDDSDVSPLPTRIQGDFHGTPCAGVAVGEENGEGIVGIAPNCAFLPVRFDLRADDNLLFEIFDYAGRRANILSCSWGPVPVFAPLSMLLDQQLTDLSNMGGPQGKGCLIFFSAGNYNAPLRDMDNERFVWRHPRLGLRETRGPIVNGHAVHPDTVAVAASTSQNRKSAYSNWGKEISVAAPSDNWHPLDPQLRLPGRGIWTIDNEDSGFGFEAGSRYTGQFGGTSSAAPLAAGIGALILSVNPGLTASQVRKILEESCDKIVDREADPVLGLKKGTYGDDGHSEWFGFGKVNAHRALLAASDTGPADEEQEPAEAKDGRVFIVSGLVNPRGRDRGNEKILLLNASDQEVLLEGWILRDEKGREDQLGPVLIGAHETRSITLQSVRLTNKGTTIQLYDFRRELIDEVSYDRADVGKPGWMIKL